MASNVPMPLNDPLIVLPRKNLKPGQTDPNAGKINEVWIPYFNSKDQQLAAAVSAAAPQVSLTAQAATIGATPIPSNSLAGGSYRITYAAWIDVVGSVSSSLTVSFQWTRQAKAYSISAAAITGNTTTTFQSGTLLITVDSATPITYSTTYASNLAGEMQYALDVFLEGPL